jgi:hypothetical protein
MRVSVCTAGVLYQRARARSLSLSEPCPYHWHLTVRPCCAAGRCDEVAFAKRPRRRAGTGGAARWLAAARAYYTGLLAGRRQRSDALTAPPSHPLLPLTLVVVALRALDPRCPGPSTQRTQSRELRCICALLTNRRSREAQVWQSWARWKAKRAVSSQAPRIFKLKTLSSRPSRALPELWPEPAATLTTTHPPHT